MEAGASPKYFTVKIHPDGPYFMGERIASPAFYDATQRPYIAVEYTLSASLPKADLTVYESFIDTNPTWPVPNTPVTVNATIKNTGAATARRVQVDFYDDDPESGGVLLGSDEIDMIPGGGYTGTASIHFTAVPGRHPIHVVIDPENSIAETDERNNSAFSVFPVLEDYSEYSEGFEFGFGDWIYDFDTPQEGMTGRNRESYTIPTKDKWYKGKQCLFSYLDGCGDDGTVWMERSIPVPKYTLLNVKFSFAFGVQSDLATVIMYYIGNYDPEIELDFSEAGMSEGWKVYSFDRLVYTSSSNRLFFGGGYTARWETELFKYMDEFKITITPY